MNQFDTDVLPASAPDAGRRWLPALLVLFIGSGCAALIYEVVWFQLLQLSVGSSAVSLGILLGIFMGGMCLGSLLLPRLVSARYHPLRVYALLELGIGALGVVVLATILRSHRLRLVSNAKVAPARRGATMGPSDGIPMIYEGARALS